MLNSEKFLNAFSSIEKYLRQKTKVSYKYDPFYQLLEEIAPRNSIIRGHKDRLKKYADLRNVIVHERADGQVIAEPNDGAVAALERIATLILAPPKVSSMFQRKVLTMQATDSISKAVKQMLSRDYSQVPIRNNHAFAGLLTANTVTRWLGMHAADDVFSLSETTIGQVLKSAEEKNDYFFLSSSTTVADALDQFNNFEQKGHRLEAALITHDGKSSQEIIGIITVADLPKAIKAIS